MEPIEIWVNGTKLVICFRCLKIVGAVKSTGFVLKLTNCRHYEWHLNTKGGLATLYVKDGEIYSLHPRRWLTEIVRRK